MLASNHAPGTAATPWVWLGFADIWLCEHPASGRWQPMKDADHGAWAPALAFNGGSYRPANAGLRLGLGWRDEQHRLDAEILDALSAHLGQAPLVFAPPRQLAGLARLQTWLHRPAAGLLLDATLLQADPAGAPAIETGSEHYKTSWPANATRLRRDPQRALPAPLASTLQAVRPALFEVSDYADGGHHPLARIQPNGRLPALTTELSERRQVRRGVRAPVLGLVWGWGHGPNLWQWALPTLKLPQPGPWRLAIDGHGRCRIEHHNQCLQRQLQPPIQAVTRATHGDHQAQSPATQELPA